MMKASNGDNTSPVEEKKGHKVDLKEERSKGASQKQHHYDDDQGSEGSMNEEDIVSESPG